MVSLESQQNRRKLDESELEESSHHSYKAANASSRRSNNNNSNNNNSNDNYKAQRSSKKQQKKQQQQQVNQRGPLVESTFIDYDDQSKRDAAAAAAAAAALRIQTCYRRFSTLRSFQQQQRPDPVTNCTTNYNCNYNNSRISQPARTRTNRRGLLERNPSEITMSEFGDSLHPNWSLHSNHSRLNEETNHSTTRASLANNSSINEMDSFCSLEDLMDSPKTSMFKRNNNSLEQHFQLQRQQQQQQQQQQGDFHVHPSIASVPLPATTDIRLCTATGHSSVASYFLAAPAPPPPTMDTPVMRPQRRLSPLPPAATPRPPSPLAPDCAPSRGNPSSNDDNNNNNDTHCYYNKPVQLPQHLPFAISSSESEETFSSTATTDNPHSIRATHSAMSDPTTSDSSCHRSSTAFKSTLSLQRNNKNNNNVSSNKTSRWEDSHILEGPFQSFRSPVQPPSRKLSPMMEDGDAGCYTSPTSSSSIPKIRRTATDSPKMPLRKESSHGPSCPSHSTTKKSSATPSTRRNHHNHHHHKKDSKNATNSTTTSKSRSHKNRNNNDDIEKDRPMLLREKSTDCLFDYPVPPPQRQESVTLRTSNLSGDYDRTMPSTTGTTPTTTNYSSTPSRRSRKTVNTSWNVIAEEQEPYSLSPPSTPAASAAAAATAESTNKTRRWSLTKEIEASSSATTATNEPLAAHPPLSAVQDALSPPRSQSWSRMPESPLLVEDNSPVMPKRKLSSGKPKSNRDKSSSSNVLPLAARPPLPRQQSTKNLLASQEEKEESVDSFQWNNNNDHHHQYHQQQHYQEDSLEEGTSDVSSLTSFSTADFGTYYKETHPTPTLSTTNSRNNNNNNSRHQERLLAASQGHKYLGVDPTTFVVPNTNVTTTTTASSSTKRRTTKKAALAAATTNTSNTTKWHDVHSPCSVAVNLSTTRTELARQQRQVNLLLLQQQQQQDCDELSATSK